MTGVDRRTLLTAAAGTAAIAGAAPALATQGETAAAPFDRGAVGGYRRLPSLDAEGRLDFLWGIERYNGEVQAPAAEARALALLAERGIDGTAPVETADAVALLGPDTTIALRHKTYLDTERLKMRVVRDAFLRDEAHHLSALDRAMAKGTGTLTLDTGFVVPEYARHSLHMQPGGYVGDPFAGQVFQHAIVGLASGHNFQNETHESIASVVPTPADGRVARILDLGCGIGQLASALHERFPQAEVWGVDTSAPMLRYAHLRASDLGHPLQFSQQNAEAMRFPDAQFDIITASGLFHEIPGDATRAIVAEVARVLRPGGVFYPLDLNTADAPRSDARSRFSVWLSYRWFHEDWRNDYAAVDLAAEMRRVGLDVNEKGPALKLMPNASPNIMATRPA